MAWMSLAKCLLLISWPKSNNFIGGIRLEGCVFPAARSHPIKLHLSLMLPRAFHFQRPETKWWTSFGEYCCSGRVVAWDSKSGLPPCESTYMLTCLHAHMLTCIQHTCIRAYMQTCVHVRACMYGCIHTSARFKVLWQRIEPNPFSGRKHLSFIIRPDVKLPFLCEGAQQVR